LDEDPFDIAARAFSAFNRRDMRSLLALCHPEIEWVPMRQSRAGVSYRGPAGVLRALEDLDREFEEMRIDPRRWEREDGWLVVAGRFVAKERNGGLRLDNPGAWLVRLEEGRVTHMRAFADEASARAAARESGG
jgi:ketosteroid isomerase-like protein